MKIALAQTNIIWENKEANEACAMEYIAQAANAGAKAVFFPEMSLTGFSMNTEKTAERNGMTVSRFGEAAAKYKIAVGIGWTGWGESLAENHFSVLNETGEIISDYIKIHPFSYGNEDKFFTPGNKMTYFKLGNYHWSSLICYDLRFPELFQIASQTAEVIVVSANWPKKREEHWRHLLCARAIESQCYILGVNCVGIINDTEYSGGSCVISPHGKIMGVLDGKAGILTVDLQDRIEELRKDFPVKKDRRWDFYISEYGRQK